MKRLNATWVDKKDRPHEGEIVGYVSNEGRVRAVIQVAGRLYAQPIDNLIVSEPTTKLEVTAAPGKFVDQEQVEKALENRRTRS